MVFRGRLSPMLCFLERAFTHGVLGQSKRVLFLCFFKTAFTVVKIPQLSNGSWFMTLYYDGVFE